MADYIPRDDYGDNMTSIRRTARYTDDPNVGSTRTFTADEVKSDGPRCIRSHSFEGSNVIITSGQDNEGARDSPGRLSRQDSTSSTSSSSESGRSRQPIVVEVQVRKGHRSSQQASQPTGRTPSPAPFVVISQGGATRIGRNPITTTIRTGYGFPSGRMSPSVLHSGFSGIGSYIDGGGGERNWDSGGGYYVSSPTPSSCSSPVSSSSRSGYRPFHTPSPSPSPSTPARVIPLPVLHTTSTGVSPDSYEFNVARATSPHIAGYHTPPPPPYTPPLDTPTTLSRTSSSSPSQHTFGPGHSSSQDGKVSGSHVKDADFGVDTRIDSNNTENKPRYEGGKSRDIFVIDNRITDKDNQRAQPHTDVQQVSDYSPSASQQQAENICIKCHRNVTNTEASQPSVEAAAAAASKHPGKDNITLKSSTDAVVSPGSPAASTPVAAPSASISNEGRQEAYSLKAVPSENRDQEPRKSYHETPDDPNSKNKSGNSRSQAEILPPETNTGLSLEEVEKIKAQVTELEGSLHKLKDENSKLQNDLNEKSILEKQIVDYTAKLKTMEQKCSELEEDKKELEDQVQIEKMKVAKGQLESRSLTELRKLLEESDNIRKKLNEENSNLRDEVNEMKLEVDEMYDQFRESDAEDFRELQKELEITAKNCRILQFKLRKAERRNDQIETEREHYEDKLRNLQDAFESQDARRHIQALEEELKMAKEVSVRLHDELDIVEEKRSRVEDDNRKLQDMLELSDKKNFRMEMEIDKLRDKVADLQSAMAKLANCTQDASSNRKVMLGQLPKQSSSETEPQQLMRELYDTLERENDLKEQMKFTELEAKNMRKKLSDLEEENESLTLQIKKLMAAKTIFTKKSDEAGSAAKEIELNLMLEMSERENAIARRKVAELDHMNDSLQEEVKYLEKRIDEKEQEMNKVPEPTTPNAYYEDKIRELTEETDELKWKLIEKDREIERLSALVQNINTKQNRLKKSRSLDSDNQVVDLNRQLNHVQQEASILRDKLVKIESENERYIRENRKLQFQVSHKVPTVTADDAALENVELKALVKKLEFDNKELNSKVRLMCEDVRKMSKETFKLPLTPTYIGSKTDDMISPSSKHTIMSPVIGSPTATRTDRIGDVASVSGSRGISINIGGCKIGSPAEGTDKVPGIPSTNSNQDRLAASRDAEKVKQLEKEAAEHRRKMTELEAKNARMSRELNRINSEKTAEEVLNNSQLAPLATENMSAEDRVRRELMQEIHDLEDEIDEQAKKLQDVEEKNIELDLEVKQLTEELSTIKEESLKKEDELLEELQSLQEKYSVLSNLLDIVKERADEAENELEKFRCSSSTHSVRSTSNISALSDSSLGSDEVFTVPRSPGGTENIPGEDEVIIDKDWEKQFRKRIGCLETLLAEERSKLLASEKKLKLISTDIVSTGLSDDAKLHLREKELLQEELLESQKHMRIANDQISGLRERMIILEEENLRLKEDYKKLEIEMTTSKTGEISQGSINIHRENHESMIKKLQEELTTYKSLIKSLEIDCAKFKLQSEEYEYKMNNYRENMEKFSVNCKKYKEQAEELEYKVAELNEIWRSKSAASEKEKQSIQIRLKNKILDLRSKEDLLLKLQKTLQVKTVSLAEKERIIKAKESAISTRDEVIRGLEEISKQRDNDFQALIEQVSSQDENAKKLRESLRQRDERLREKDDILQKLNNNIGIKQDEVKNLDNAVRDSITRLSQKEEELKKLRTHISEVENMKTMSETDEQKENTALKNKFTELLISVKRLTDDKEKLSKDLSILKNNLNDKESKSLEEKNVLQIKIRTLNERLTNVTKTTMMNEKDSMRILRQDNQNMIEEKSRLNCEIRNLRQEMDGKQKLLDSQADITQALESKRKQVEELAAINKRQQESIDRLESQATLAYQLQQEERVRKAEQLAMKVRYETKIEKLQRDYNQLLINSERVAKERELQQEIIRGVQRGMFNLKDKYTQDRSRWQTDKEMFETKATEAEKGQNEVNQLKSQVEKLQMKVEDQERLFLEQANKFATEKSALEIDYSSILSEKNQLENHMASLSKSSEDEMMSKKVWEKERAEQKRLLTEAHNLAMDLQQQLKSRDEAYSKERKQLMNRLESERFTWDKKRVELEKKFAELESSGRKLKELQIKYQDLEETNVKDQQNWLIEKNELVRQVAEQRQRLLKDSRKIEDLLYQLNHIKSLLEMDKGPEGEINANIISRSSKHFPQTVSPHLQEVSIVVNTMSEDLMRYIDSKDREVQSQVRRSLSSTQLELHKELENVLGTDTSSGLLSPVSAGNGSSITRSHTSDALQKMTVTTSSTELLTPQLTMSYNTKSRSPSPSRASKQKPQSVSVSSSQAASSLSGELPKNKTLIKSISMDNQEVIFSVSSTKSEEKPPKTQPLVTKSATSLNLSMSSTLPRMSTSTTTIPSSSAFQPIAPNLPIPTRSVSSDNVSPMSARKQFFANKPVSDYGMSWPRRGAGFGHSRQMSMPDAGEIKVLTSSESKHSVSWSDSIKVVESEKREITVASSSTENVVNVKPVNVKEKRRLFKKSSSVDNPVMSSIARVGFQAAQPAAPSIMKPSDLFKAMKQKLRPSFKKTFSFDSNPLKPSGEGSTPTESLQSWGASASTSPEQLTPEILDDPPMSAFHPIQTPPVENEDRDKLNQKTVQSDEESDRLGRMITSDRKKAYRKNRSKSADSRHEDKLRPLIVHADVITPIRVWEFSETPV